MLKFLFSRSSSAIVSLLREPIDHGPAGIAEPQQLGGLVEGLAGGVVAAGAELAIAADPGAQQQLGVPARHEQQQIGEGHIVGEPRRQGVRMMVHFPIRIYYRIHEDLLLIEILHFWHGSRQEP